MRRKGESTSYFDTLREKAAGASLWVSGTEASPQRPGGEELSSEEIPDGSHRYPGADSLCRVECGRSPNSGGTTDISALSIGSGRFLLNEKGTEL